MEHGGSISGTRNLCCELLLLVPWAYLVRRRWSHFHDAIHLRSFFLVIHRATSGQGQLILFKALLSNHSSFIIFLLDGLGQSLRDHVLRLHELVLHLRVVLQIVLLERDSEIFHLYLELKVDPIEEDNVLIGQLIGLILLINLRIVLHGLLLQQGLHFEDFNRFFEREIARLNQVQAVRMLAVLLCAQIHLNFVDFEVELLLYVDRGKVLIAHRHLETLHVLLLLDLEVAQNVPAKHQTAHLLLLDYHEGERAMLFKVVVQQRAPPLMNQVAHAGP